VPEVRRSRRVTDERGVVVRKQTLMTRGPRKERD
jgi:hypothetical protein